MNKRYLRRSVVAVGLAITTLMAMSNPAGAMPFHEGSIDAGIITSTKTGVTETFNLNPTTASCPGGSSLKANFGTETIGGTFLVTSLSSSHVTTFSGTSGTYLTVLSRSTTGNSAGTWSAGSSTSHSVVSARIAIVVTIYNTTSCTITTTPICTVAAILHITSTFPSSFAIGNRFSTDSGSSVGTVAAFPTCASGPSQILGTTLAVTTPIEGEITTSTTT